jgi:hypothetical protein
MINGVCPVNPLVGQTGFKNDIDAHRGTHQMWLYHQYYFELIGRLTNFSLFEIVSLHALLYIKNFKS